MTTYPVHPAANLMPRLSDAGIAALAADIKANGQHEPVVLFEGQVLDGRHRLAACGLAGVAPTFRTLATCPDPEAFVLSVNLRRRHLRHIDRVRLAWLRRDHWQEVLRKRQADAARETNEKRRNGKKTLVGDSPQASLKWFDLAAQETDVKGDAVKTYDEIMAAGCPALSALVDGEGLALDPASRLAREVRQKNLTAAALTKELDRDHGRTLLDSLKKPREPKTGPTTTATAPTATATTAPTTTEEAPVTRSPGHQTKPARHPFLDELDAAPDLATLDRVYSKADRAGLVGDEGEEAGRIYQRRGAELRAQAAATVAPAPVAPPSQPAPVSTPAPSQPRQADLFADVPVPVSTQAPTTQPEKAAAVGAMPADTVTIPRAEYEAMRSRLVELEGLSRWCDETAARAGDDDEGSIKKAMRLIALASSPNENEARSAAYQASRIIRERGLFVSTSLPSGSGIHLANQDDLQRANAEAWADLWRDIENLKKSRGVQL